MTIDHSFAIMAYKDSPYLSECLDSLNGQSIQSEIYLTTSTPSPFINEIAKKYGIDVFVTESGKGIAHDWNFALRMASTRYVTLAHQDDLYLPEYAEVCIKACEKFHDTLICFSKYIEIIGKKERSKTLLLGVKNLMLTFFMPFKKNIHGQTWKLYLLSTGNPIPAPSVMYNLENLNGFQFSTEFSINMDWDAWCRMARLKGRFVYVKKVLMKHRIHSDSATSKGLQANLRQNEDMKMFRRFWPGLLANIFAKIYAMSYNSNEDNVS